MHEDNTEEHSYQNYSPVIDPSLAREIMDTEGVLDSLRLALKGYDIDYQTDPPRLIEFGKPLINDLGLGKLMSRLKSLNKIIIMSNFDKQIPWRFTRLQGFHVLRDLMINMNEYGIADTNDFFTVLDIFLNHMLAIFQRAVGEGERRFYKGFASEKHILGGEKRRGLSLT